MTQDSLSETLRIGLHGRLDASATDDLNALLEESSDLRIRRLLVDLGEVTYVSSTVLRSLLLAHRRQQEKGGRLELVRVPPRVMRILSMAGFDRILTVTPEDASPGHTGRREV